MRNASGMAATLVHPRREDFLAGISGVCVRPLQAMLCEPSLIFLGAMTVMLFRVPDYRFHSYDRFAFVLLVAIIFLRCVTLRERISLHDSIKWPMLGMVILAVASALSEPYDPETWSGLASKWIVPFSLFWIAGYVFRDARALKRFEGFSLLTLAYLVFISVAFLLGAKQLVFPRYILDESFGIHADRARGPFLQAVANGVTLNLLGLIALDSFRRKRLRGLPAIYLLVFLPIAIVATKTRAVWLSFGASIVVLLFLSANRRLRRTCTALLLAGIAGLALVLSACDRQHSLSDRMEETSQVKFRMAVYQAGWNMFLEKPWLGWNRKAMQAELANQVSDFHQEEFYFHNTYLEILVQYGVVGLALYAWIVGKLFRIGRRSASGIYEGEFLDGEFRSLWPILLGVYLVNGSFVVMNYQFVNGMIFSLGGMLSAQNRSLTGVRNAI